MYILNDLLWQLDHVSQAALVNRFTGILHASRHHWGHGKLQPGANPKGIPLAQSAQTATQVAMPLETNDWQGKLEQNYSQA
jgi:hypothetical protein